MCRSLLLGSSSALVFVVVSNFAFASEPSWVTRFCSGTWSAACRTWVTDVGARAYDRPHPTAKKFKRLHIGESFLVNPHDYGDSKMVWVRAYWKDFDEAQRAWVENEMWVERKNIAKYEQMQAVHGCWPIRRFHWWESDSTMAAITFRVTGLAHIEDENETARVRVKKNLVLLQSRRGEAVFVGRYEPGTLSVEQAIYEDEAEAEEQTKIERFPTSMLIGCESGLVIREN